MIQPKSIWALIKETVHEWQRDNVSRLAAALAFYTVFSLAPTLMVVVAVAGAVAGTSAAQYELFAQVRQLIGPRAANFLQLVLESSTSGGGGGWATSVGAVTALFGATVVFAELQTALNTIWHVRPKPELGWRRLVYVRALSFLTVLGIGVFLLLSLAFNTSLAAAKQYLRNALPLPAGTLEALNLVVSFALITFLFAVIYKILPDVEIVWSDVWIGATITSLLFTVGKSLISIYLGTSSLRSVYGAAGSLVIILVWVYYSAQVFFFGAKFTQVYARKYGSTIKPSEHATRFTLGLDRQ